jgi:hypothetical protein
MSSISIAVLVHSTNPRGGVVHAMELCSALDRIRYTPHTNPEDNSLRVSLGIRIVL